MKKRSISLIIGLMSLALLGVIAMQLYFLRQSYEMQSALFDRSVNEALNNFAAQVSKRDAINFLSLQASAAKYHQNFLNNKVGFKNQELLSAHTSAFSGVGVKPQKKLTKLEKKIALWRDSLRRMILHKKMDDEMTRIIQSG